MSLYGSLLLAFLYKNPIAERPTYQNTNMMRKILSKSDEVLEKDSEKHLYLQAFASFEICKRDQETGFKFQPGDAYISSKKLLDILEQGYAYQCFGNNILVPTSLILRSIITCLSKVTPTTPTKRRSPKTKLLRGASNSYMHFNGFFRKIITAAIPEYRPSDVSKLIAALWRASSQETKTIFQKKAEQQKSIWKDLENKYPSIALSKRYKRRNGRFVDQSLDNDLKTEGTKNGNGLALFCGVSSEDNVEDYIAMSLATVSCDTKINEEEEIGCDNLLMANTNQESNSCQIMSWIDNWNPWEWQSNEVDLVSWSRASTDLSIYLGNIYQNSYQPLDSIYFNDTDFEPCG
jgi:HMG (high mobility group) box